MIDLRQHREPLLRFIESALTEFRRTHPAEPIRHVALYCCPWRGSVWLCLDPAQQGNQNCPDFLHSQVAVYQATQWAEEYEQAAAMELIDLAGQTREVDITAEGDEALNGMFFGFLTTVLHEPSSEATIRRVAGNSVRLGVQCLDSAFNESWSPAA